MRSLQQAEHNKASELLNGISRNRQSAISYMLIFPLVRIELPILPETAKMAEVVGEP